MIDLKPYIAGLLSETAAVELTHSDGLRTLPVIILTETGGGAEIVIGNKERVSRVNIQLDVYAEEMSEAEEISAKASAVMTAAGFKRSFSDSLFDENAARKCMRFTCGVDEVSGRVLAL